MGYDNEMHELRNDIEEMLNQLDNTKNYDLEKHGPLFIDAFDDYDTG